MWINSKHRKQCRYIALLKFLSWVRSSLENIEMKLLERKLLCCLLTWLGPDAARDVGNRVTQVITYSKTSLFLTSRLLSSFPARASTAIIPTCTTPSTDSQVRLQFNFSLAGQISLGENEIKSNVSCSFPGVCFIWRIFYKNWLLLKQNICKRVSFRLD